VSFRNRLTLFFVAIVILPMVSMAFVLFRLLSDNERGKADARIAARQQTARNLFAEDAERAGRLAAPFGGDPALARALRAGDDAAATRRAEALLQQFGIARVRISTAGGRTIVDSGSAVATAVAERELVDPGGRRYRLELSDRTAPAFARSVRRITGLHVVVRSGGRTLGTTLRGVPGAPLPEPVGSVTVGETEYRVASFADREGFGDARTQVAVFAGQEATDEAIGQARLLAGALLAGFFILAFTFAAVVSRSLQSRIAAFLHAARRLGRGDFSSEVPVEGNDEFASLGVEFNSMARQLEGPAGGAGRAAHAPGEPAPPHRRGVRVEPRSRRAARDRGADDGRRRRRRRRPRAAAARSRRTRRSSARRAATPPALAEVVAQVEGEVLACGQPREVASENGQRARPPAARRARRGAGRRLGVAPRPARSRRTSASCSTTSPRRPACRWRTSTCTRPSSARRSPTS
jgi:HAMP domain-containing protein